MMMSHGICLNYEEKGIRATTGRSKAEAFTARAFPLWRAVIALLVLFLSVVTGAAATGDNPVRPALITEKVYADQRYKNPPDDELTWTKILLDMNIKGFAPRVSQWSYSRCNYQSAFETLRDIRSQMGKDARYQKIWAENQDRVFAACEGKSDTPPVRPTGKSLPGRANGDFLYQLGSWNFYRRDYPEALKNYEQAERLKPTPQRAKAAYMTVRTLAYMNHAEEAYHKIEKILSDPSLREVHDIANNYRFVIMNNTRSFSLDVPPRLALEHLNWLQEIIRIAPERLKDSKRALTEQQDALEQLNSYFPPGHPDTGAIDWWLKAGKLDSPKMAAVRTLAPRIPLIDWMQAKWAYNIFDIDWLWALHQKDNPYWKQNRNIVDHVMERWRTDKDGVWLQIAIRRVHPRDARALEIVAVAEPFLKRSWKTETPEYREWLFDLWANLIRIHLGRERIDKAISLISEHFDFGALMSTSGTYARPDFAQTLENTLRWLVYTGQVDHARSCLDIIQGKHAKGFRQWRSLLARDLNEAIAAGFGTEDSYDLFTSSLQSFWQEMVNVLPSGVLYSIASDERVKLINRAMISRTLFTRAVLLKYDNATLDKYAALTAKVNPIMREQLLEGVAGHDREKYIEFLLKMPRFRPAAYLEYGEENKDKKDMTIDAIDVWDHNDNNWWCRYNFKKFQERIFNAMRIVPNRGDAFSAEDELAPYMSNQKKLLSGHPYAALIDPREIEALEKIPSGPQYLSEAVIKTEKESMPSMSDEQTRNKRAANLHRAVRTTRYGCYLDGSHEAYSREAFTLLHARYNDTPWAKATPYWFANPYSYE